MTPTNTQKKHTAPAATSVKAFMETPSYLHAKALLNAEINNDGTLKIDRNCFKKTPQEKADLANAKRAYKKMIKQQNS